MYRSVPFIRTITWHNGETGGYHAFMGVDTGAGGGLVVLGNAATNIDDIGLHLLNPSAPLRHPEQRATVPVASTILDQ